MTSKGRYKVEFYKVMQSPYLHSRSENWVMKNKNVRTIQAMEIKFLRGNKKCTTLNTINLKLYVRS